MPVSSRTVRLAVCIALGTAGCSLLPQQQAQKPASAPSAADGADAVAGGAYAVVGGAYAVVDGAYAVARAHQLEGRYDEAAALYRRVIAEQPRHADAHNALGAVLAAQGRAGEAVEEFRRALAIDPSLAYVHANLARIYLQRGDDERAAASLESARQLDAADTTVARELAGVYARLLAKAREDRDRLQREASLQAAPARENADAAIVQREQRVYELRPSPARPAIPVLPAQKRDRVMEVKVDSANQRPFTLEVANGNGVGGAARAVSEQLAARGFAKARLTNQKPFAEPATRIQYREGFAAEAARVSEALSGAVIAGSVPLRPGTDVRVLLGHDAVGVASRKAAPAALAKAEH